MNAPPPTTATDLYRCELRLPVAVAAELRDLARREDRSLAAEVRRAVAEHLARHREQEA